MPRLILTISAAALLNCSALRHKPDVDIACDGLSAVGIAYHQSLSDELRSTPVATAKLDLYPAGTLSRIAVTSARNESSIDLQESFGYARPGLPLMTRDDGTNEYRLFLIPPRASGNALGQWGEDPDDPNKTEDYPAFIAVPENTFDNGTCDMRTTSFVIAAVEIKSFQTLPQFVVPLDALVALVNRFYVDKRSSDAAYLSERLSQANLVNEALWRGWVRLRVTQRDRWVWEQMPQNSEEVSSDDALGFRIEVPFAPSTVAPLRELLFADIHRELEHIAEGWFSKIGGYSAQLAAMGAEMSQLEQRITERRLTAAEYQASVQRHVTDVKHAEEALAALRTSMAEQRGWFLTDLEAEMYLDALRSSLDVLVSNFNKLTSAYTNATRIATTSTLDPQLFLAGAPIAVGGEVRDPVQNSFSSTEANFGAPLTTSTVAFARTEGTGYVIVLRGLINITQTMNSASGHFERLVRNQESCSKKIRSIRTNVREDVRPDTFERHAEAELESRTCWSWRGVRGWTRNFRATARARVYAKLRQTADGDLAVRYGWKASVRVLIVHFGDGEEWSLGSVRGLITRQDIAAAAAKYGLRISEAGFVKDRQNDAYLAVSLETKPLSADEAAIALALLGSL